MPKPKNDKKKIRDEVESQVRMYAKKAYQVHLLDEVKFMAQNFGTACNNTPEQTLFFKRFRKEYEKWHRKLSRRKGWKL